MVIVIFYDMELVSIAPLQGGEIPENSIKLRIIPQKSSKFSESPFSGQLSPLPLAKCEEKGELSARKELMVNHLALNINYCRGSDPRSPAEETRAAASSPGGRGVLGALGGDEGGAMGEQGRASRTQLAAQLINYGTPAAGPPHPRCAAPGRPLRACARPPYFFYLFIFLRKSSED